MSVTVVDSEVQMIVVYDGPRGLPGGKGGPGGPGPQGPGFRVRGAWAGNVAYISGDAVLSRSSTSPDVSNLWILKDGAVPTLNQRPDQQPDLWEEIGNLATDSALGAVTRVNQVLHNFTTRGEPVAFSNQTGRFEQAHCMDKDFLCIGVIADIVDADEFVIQVSGRLNAIDATLIFDPPPPAGRGINDWEPGKIYHLSPSIGQYQIADPTRQGWISQPCVMPVGITGPGQPSDIILLTWGPEGLAPTTVEGDLPPVNARMGALWFRTGDWPGLYALLPDATGDGLYWVQTNG